MFHYRGHSTIAGSYFGPFSPPPTPLRFGQPHSSHQIITFSIKCDHIWTASRPLLFLVIMCNHLATPTLSPKLSQDTWKAPNTHFTYKPVLIFKSLHSSRPSVYCHLRHSFLGSQFTTTFPICSPSLQINVWQIRRTRFGDKNNYF